jgi:hypothetical protein
MTFSGTSRRRALKLGLAASLAAPAVARDQFAQRIRSEIEKWEKAVAAADVRID